MSTEKSKQESNRRELLLDFLKEQEYCGLVEILEDNFEHYVDEYLKSKEFEREQREQALKVALSEADEDSLYGMMHKLGYLVQKHKDLKN